MTPHLTHLRAAIVARWDALAARCNEGRAPRATTPQHTLMDATAYLIEQGAADEPPCDGERRFNMPMHRVRTYLDALPPAERAAMAEAGRRSIYAGRHPICPVVDERNVA